MRTDSPPLPPITFRPKPNWPGILFPTAPRPAESGRDVFDVAEPRRGNPTRNAIWANHTSVLAGYWLYMQSFQIALRLRNFHLLDILISLTQAMVEGELLQLERIGKIGISEADYMELVDRKTASLFSACARLGAVAGSPDEALEQKLGEFAW